MNILDLGTSRDQALLVVPGFMKSGTTTLHAMLKDHPEIAPHAQKEPGFFGETEVVEPEEYLKGFGPDRSSASYLLDASTIYGRPYRNLLEIIRRISDFPLPVRILFIARNPIDRLRSHIRGHIDAGLIGKADSRRFWQIYVMAGMYGSIYGAYVKAFGTENVDCVIFEQLLQDPEGARSKIAGFLGIDPLRFPDAPPHLNKSSEATESLALPTKMTEQFREELNQEIETFRQLSRADTSNWSF